MRARCLELQAKKQWTELHACTETLATLDPARAKELAEIAASELRSEVALDRLANAIHGADLPAAYASYSVIPLSSVYAAAAMKRYAPFEAAAIEKLVIAARDLANRGRCDEVEALAVKASAPAATSAVRAAGCKKPVDPFATRSGGAPAPPCDADALVASGDQAFGAGAYADALTAFEAANRCHPDTKVLARAYLSACRATKTSKAIELFQALPPALQNNGSYIQMCLVSGIDPRATPSRPPTPKTCQPMSAVNPYSAVAACGALDLQSVPTAGVMLDGVDTGASTPTRIPDVTPGKHKVTLRVGADKFTFSVTVEAGQTVTLSKQLQ